MAGSRFFPVLQRNPDENRWKTDVVNIVNNILKGKINTTGEVTLTANTTTTTVSNSNVSDKSYIGLSPNTSNAAAAITTTYISSRTNGENFILTHANNAQTDRIFTYVIVG